MSLDSLNPMGAPVYSDLRGDLFVDTRFLEDALDKGKAIDAAVSQIERQFGKGSIMRMGEEERQSVAIIPTGPGPRPRPRRRRRP